ncbi:TlpA family protein disulfide reductase [Sphingobacterium faecium]|uniref:TlpA family protein disulfide reductase n=1 Tax=Sphingobacterium faecium TaxID=34087 RepID=UPI002479DA4C|nr:TlpA family protein disulfide reductase [Sphingobacterium faecium]WGQ16895.1 TlpA family protein disulfide reductase [Sphingobacterium faecium]
MKSIQYNLYKTFMNKRARAILLCLVSMFSLSAQTPRKDSGADGSNPGQPVMLGFRVPEEFWSHKFMIFENGKYIKQTLEKYRGKPLVLDFWATWCPSCIAKFPKVDQFKKIYGDHINFILVNSFDIDTKKIARVLTGEGTGRQPTETASIVNDVYLKQLFPHQSVPIYIWLDEYGRLQASSTANFLNDDQVRGMVERMKGGKQ